MILVIIQFIFCSLLTNNLASLAPSSRHVFISKMLESTQIKNNKTTTLPLSSKRFKQLPAPLKIQYFHAKRRHIQQSQFRKKILIFGIPLLSLSSITMLIIVLPVLITYLSGIPLIITLIITLGLILGTFGFGLSIFIIIYTFNKPKKFKEPYFFSLPDLTSENIQYPDHEKPILSTDLSEEQKDAILLHLSLSPIGAYTVLKKNKKESLLAVRTSLQHCSVFSIPSSKATQFTYVRNLLHSYLPKNIILTPFSLNANKDLINQTIISGAGVGFELEGKILFHQNPTDDFHIATCPESYIPGRGPTHFPSFFKTTSTPRVGISRDSGNSLELVTEPIRYSRPSQRKDADQLVFNTIETWKAIEEQVSYHKQPLLTILDKASKKNTLTYEKSEDKNNLVDPQKVSLKLGRYSLKPINTHLQCTYSIPIESLSSYPLSVHDEDLDYQTALQTAQRLVQIDLIDSLEEYSNPLHVHDLKKLEGFFTALFYILKQYKTNHTYLLAGLTGTPPYAKYFFSIYIKHNLYDLFTLLPPHYQNFLTQLSKEPHNILYMSIAKYLKTPLNKPRYLANWYISNLGWSTPKTSLRTNHSLSELLDILFQRHKEEKSIWFLDDTPSRFDRNEDDPTNKKKRLLVELRTLPSANNQNHNKSCMDILIKGADVLSPYNTLHHFFDHTTRRHILKSA